MTYQRNETPGPLATTPEVVPNGKMHSLKTDPDVFDAVWKGLKTFEIRFNDRDFKAGDWLSLHETRHSGADMKAGAPLDYTGRTMSRQVSHVLSGYGLADGWVCLSLAAPSTGAPLPLARLNDIAREAQIAFCLGKQPSFDIAFARGIEAAHGIAA